MVKDGMMLWKNSLKGLLVIGLGLGLFYYLQGANSQERQLLKPAETVVAGCITKHSDECEPQAGQASQLPVYRFVAFGDWGAGTPFQKSVAEQLARTYQQQPYQAILLLGDNIYPVGDIAKHGQAYFTDMYAPLLAKQVPFIVALGNHDIAGGHQMDQLRFFHMPGFYYVVPRVGNAPVDVFVINTNTFANDELQQKWLDKALGASTADWKIVMGHHPIYSSGEHGFNKGLKASLEPVLVKRHVDLYLAGHDHDYERFAPIQGVTHVVSGGGGAYLRGFNAPMPGSVARLKAHHFLLFEQSGNVLQMRAIDKAGQIIDTNLLEKTPLVVPKVS